MLFEKGLRIAIEKRKVREHIRSLKELLDYVWHLCEEGDDVSCVQYELWYKQLQDLQAKYITLDVMIRTLGREYSKFREYLRKKAYYVFEHERNAPRKAKYFGLPFSRSFRFESTSTWNWIADRPWEIARHQKILYKKYIDSIASWLSLISDIMLDDPVVQWCIDEGESCKEMMNVKQVYQAIAFGEDVLFRTFWLREWLKHLHR